MKPRITKEIQEISIKKNQEKLRHIKKTTFHSPLTSPFSTLHTPLHSLSLHCTAAIP